MKPTTNKKSAPCLVALAVALLATACNVHEIEYVEKSVDAEVIVYEGVLGADKVDILWIIDNSGSMCEEQAQLRQNFDLFIDQLIAINVDFRLAVITTDMMATSEAGRFQNIPRGEPGPACTVQVDIGQCPGLTNPAELPPLVIASEAYRQADGSIDAAALRRDFGCNATVGTAGSGFEMGLEAMRTALSPALLQTHNSGFLREDAHLAVIFLTDENDCSNPGAIEMTNGNICEWDRDKLTAEQEYIDALKALKPEDRLILAGIIAPDSGLRYEYGEEVLPSCTSELGTGYAGYRYQEVINAFPQKNVSNICAPNSFEAALDAIGRLIVDRLDLRCLTTPPRSCVDDDDCGGSACASRGGSWRFCEDFVLQAELLRPEGSGQDDLECEPATGGRERCILVEGLHYAPAWGSAACGGGVGLELLFEPMSGEELVVRYPRQITPL